MITKLTNKDKDKLLTYAAAEPEYNLFLIGDIENYGLDSEQVSVFAKSEGEGGAWEMVALKYYEDFLVYSPDDAADILPMAEFIASMYAKGLNGKYSFVKRFADYFPRLTLRKTYLSRLNTVKKTFSLPEGFKARLLGQEDMESYAEMLIQIEEFSASNRGDIKAIKERSAAKIAHGDDILAVFDGDKMVSSASTSGGNSVSAMVASVCTLEPYRGRGLASCAVSRLCEYELSRGKKFLCLFYDNPAAGRIYERVGFEIVGEYALML
ncbi:MAG: GNAT family N-acetyltransferase [Eubacteriaceae bacterium]|nr:GNAT family N-acetyltransferase [Eubacteriaceae bacterium]